MVHTNKTKSQPTTESVLRAIELQLENIWRHSARPGWNLWVLWGAVAALFWILIDLLPDVRAVPSTLVLLILAIYFVAASLRMVPLFLDAPDNHDKYDRYRPSHLALGPGRTRMLIHIIEYITLLAAVVYSHEQVGWFASAAGAASLVVMLVATLLAMVFSVTQMPVKIYTVQMGWKPRLAIALFALLFAASGCLYVYQLDLSLIWRSPSILKFGIGFVVMLYLLSAAVRERLAPPAAEALLRVHNELAFGNILPATAIERSEVAVVGLRASHVVQEYINRILLLLEHIDKVVRDGMTDIEALGLDEQGTNRKPTEQELIVEGLQSRIDVRLATLRKRWIEIRQEYKIFKARFKILGEVSVDEQPAITELIDRFEAAVDASIEREKTFRHAVSRALPPASVTDLEYLHISGATEHVG